MGAGKPFYPGRELLGAVVGRSRHTLPGIILAGIEHFPRVFTPAAERANVQRGLAMHRAIRELLRGDAILLFPPHPTTAPLVRDTARHGATRGPCAEGGLA